MAAVPKANHRWPQLSQVIVDRRPWVVVIVSPPHLRRMTRFGVVFHMSCDAFVSRNEVIAKLDQVVLVAFANRLFICGASPGQPLWFVNSGHPLIMCFHQSTSYPLRSSVAASAGQTTQNVPSSPITTRIPERYAYDLAVCWFWNFAGSCLSVILSPPVILIYDTIISWFAADVNRWRNEFCNRC